MNKPLSKYLQNIERNKTGKFAVFKCCWSVILLFFKCIQMLNVIIGSRSEFIFFFIFFFIHLQFILVSHNFVYILQFRLLFLNWLKKIQIMRYKFIQLAITFFILCNNCMWNNLTECRNSFSCFFMIYWIRIKDKDLWKSLDFYL